MRDAKITCETVQSRIAEDLPEFAPAEREHLAACDKCTEFLTMRLLHESPVISIPADFAARVRIRAKSESEKVATPGRFPEYGTVIAIGVLLLAALVWLALSLAETQRWAFGSELVTLLALFTLTCEIGGIGLWLGLRSSAG
jgi:hypothetical protein